MVDLSRERSWRRIDAAYAEVSDMRMYLSRIRGDRWTRFGRFLGVLPPPPMEAAVLDEISFLEGDISRMRRAYADCLDRERTGRS